MNPTFDSKDAAILAQLQEQWNLVPGPRVGDWIEMGPGDTRRLTHEYDDAFQTTMGPTWSHGGGSFYLALGYATYSGALDSAIPRTAIVQTAELRDAPFWFFHHGQARAHNGVDVSIPARVFKYTP